MERDKNAEAVSLFDWMQHDAAKFDAGQFSS